MSTLRNNTELENNAFSTNTSYHHSNDNNTSTNYKEGLEENPHIDVHNTFPRSYRALSPPHLSTAASIRSESVRSQASDCDLSSSTSDINKKVSFNNDVKIKRIPVQKSRLDIFKRASSPEKSTLQLQKLKEPGVIVEIKKEQPPENEEDIAHETNLILSQLEGVKCHSNLPSSPIKPQVAPKPDSFQQRNTNNSIASLRTRLSNSISNLSSLSAIRSGDKKNNNTNNKPISSSSGASTAINNTESLFDVNNTIEESNFSGNVEDLISDTTTKPGMRFESSDLDTTTTSGIHSGGSTEANATNTSLSSGNTHNSNDNRLYGLHALNNLDIAVNGKEVNSMPSYQEIRRRTSIGSTNSGSGGTQSQNVTGNNETFSGTSGEYSPPTKLSNHFQTTAPPKPPRKAPSQSPPSLRRGSLNNTSNGQENMEMSAPPMTHYAQPAISGAISSDTEHFSNQRNSGSIMSSMMDQLNQDAGFKRRLMQQTNALNTPEDSAIASGDGGTATDIERDNAPSISGSYTSRYIRKSPPRHLVSPTHPQSRMSPSRGCLTDTEILRSPTEVLYAVSDKQKYPNIPNDRITQSSSQIIHPENRIKNNNQHRSRRVASREELLYADPDAYHHSNTGGGNTVGGSRPSFSNRQPQPPYQRSVSDHSMKYIPASSGSTMSRHQQKMVQGSRSLERFLEDDNEADKENTFKTRITVISPERATTIMSHTNNSRKPYKTMINTATDNIQYRGTDHYATAPKYSRQPQSQRMMDNEHYKVPRSKAPVESNFFAPQRNGYRGYADSDASSSVMNYNNHHRSGGGASPSGRNQFTSTRLVKNVESRRHSGPGIAPGQHGSRELDREGRMIRSIRASHSANEPQNGGGMMSNGRLRNYSGHSTSPDRENVSPDRYSKPRSAMTSRSYSNGGHHPHNIINRSPSSSPTRPPRSRSSPTRELIHNGVRRVASRRGDVDRSPSAVGRNGGIVPNPKRAQNNFRPGSGERTSNINGHPQRPERRERSNDGRRSAMSSFNAPPRVHQNGIPKQNREHSGEDRLARFTEYRGDDVNDQQQQQQQPPQPRRPSLRTNYVGEGSVSDRERGQSLPPGATIDSIGDFYKSSQFKSMYALPPSPSRPAPVLDRGDRTVSSSTLGMSNRREGSGSRMTDRPTGPPPANSSISRLTGRPGSRNHHVSISEGHSDVTDSDALGRGGQVDKMGRPRARVTGSPTNNGMRPKRQAPSPPGMKPGIVTNGLLHGVGRRFISSDKESSRSNSAMDHTGGGRRVVSNERGGLIHPPTRRVVVGRRPSDQLDSSYSESEGINGEADQPRPWSSLSEEELDEVNYILAATNNIPATSSTIAPSTTVMSTTDLDDDDRPLSGITSTTASHFRPSSIASTATIVHIQGQQQHPQRAASPTRQVKKNHVIFYDDPYAPSYHTVIKDKQPGGGQFGRRLSGAHRHSDIDSDYRREMATANGTGSTIGSLHNEARGRGGSRTNLIPPPEDQDMIMSHELGDVDPSTTREEERRKVLEIEEERIRREREAQIARRPVSRSASRATSAAAGSRTAHVQPAGPRGFRPARHLVPDLDHDSQYSGHSSSSAMHVIRKDQSPAGQAGVNKMSRFDQHRVGVGRVKRSTSNATNNGGVVLGNAAAMHGARREINRKKMPGSLTSSINSSESEQGGAPPSAISRATSAQSASNRSVFLHAAAVADIPCAGDRPPMAKINPQNTPAPNPPAGAHVRALSADSRRDVNLAAKAGALNAKQDSNLKGSKKVSRSISLLAPWSRNRPQKENLEIHYDNSAVYSQAPATSVTVGKPPRPPQGGMASGPGSSVTISSARPHMAGGGSSILRNEKAKSASSHDLLHENDTNVMIDPDINVVNSSASVISGPGASGAPNSRRPMMHHSPPSVLVASQQRSKTLPAKGANGKVSRSMSMPKDTRITGWFKKRKRF